jgi:hypothetical protein
MGGRQRLIAKKKMGCIMSVFAHPPGRANDALGRGEEGRPGPDPATPTTLAGLLRGGGTSDRGDAEDAGSPAMLLDWW